MRMASVGMSLAFGLGCCALAAVAGGWQEEEPARLDPAPAKKAPVESDEPAEEPAAQPAAEQRAGKLEVTDVRTATFQEVRPGESTEEEVRKLLGKPAREEIEDDVTVLTYRPDPFAKVDVLLTNNLTTSIVIHLKRPTPAAQIARDLDLHTFRPAPIPDETGELLGIAFPERGVTFALTSQTDDNSVSQVLLEAVSAEPFVLRALYDFEHRYEQNLADLQWAGEKDPQDARIPWLKSQTLAAMGRREEALVAADEALKLNPESAQYHLTRAALLGELGAHDKALAETRDMLARKVLNGEDRARAECLVGDLHATGPARDFKQAFECHQAAIKLATPLAEDRRFAVRRAARQVLVEAHLAVAYDIACGPWKRKTEVVPKWLDRAESSAQELLENDRGDLLLKLNVARRMLAIHVVMRGELDPTAAASLALSEARELLAGERDPYFRRRVAWLLGSSLHDAARIEQISANGERALAYVDRAVPLLEQDLSNRPATPAEQYLLGKLYFLAGSVNARQLKQHNTASEWYDKAAPRLVAGQPAAAGEPALYGGRFISMGVSYWEIDDKEEALRLTRHGVEILQTAADAGQLEQAALKVPYGNLATMCQANGEETEARQYAALAAKSQGGTSSSQPQR